MGWAPAPGFCPYFPRPLSPWYTWEKQRESPGGTVDFMGEWVIRARAKVNLALDITGRRADGYHLLDTIMASVDLWDELILRPGKGLTLHVVGHAPAGPDNLVLKAAGLLAPLAGGRGADITLVKRIPSEAGLGGGSADAAAALMGLSALWGLALPRARLIEMALQLGADVPFMLTGGVARCRGVGEIIEPIPRAKPLWLVLLKGEEGLSTARVYAAYDRGPSPAPVDVDGAVALLDRPAALAGVLKNALEPPARALLPAIATACEDLMAAGALTAIMTGSGSAVFGLFSDGEAARRAQRALADRYGLCRAVQTCRQGMEITRR